MTIASDIISHRMPDFEAYLRAGESLDDIDEYGFTPLIECAITRQIQIAEQLIARKVNVNKTDVTGRGPLHWAVDNNDIAMAKLLLDNGADPNAYTRNGLSVLVYPVLRNQDALKHLLYQYGARLDFALDFINGKLIGHRFELQGDVDIVNAQGEFIELDYEGFILEFTVAVIRDALRRFISSYSTRHLREYFPLAHVIIDAFSLAEELLNYQHLQILGEQHLQRLKEFLKAPMLILPAASRGHAMGFIRFGQWWAKIDRGENSLQEGSVNIYRINNLHALNVRFLQDFLYKKQPRNYFHQMINQQLGLIPIAKMPISSQISGNCSWANIQAIVAVAYAIQGLEKNSFNPDTAMAFYDEWVAWDKERAIDECIQRFYLANPPRKASIAAMLGGVLFQACNAENKRHLEMAEKILKILTLPDYEYILKSYLEEYCIKRLTKKGNNLLKILDDCGINPNIGVNPIATGL
ncbi:ankyrin repeat domain-containing protein [Fluoribacter dumoffii]|uniref:Ribulose-5-phosphate 4-epimerase and related epimerases and aldolases n=1 Tax=Fluoribacter dumoffii TaxID=463 RepID=A0A377G6T2_9GAMM|nr:Dot/Icm T4SS effector AnkH/LegA3 [Fluoribacter dumoffii]KTC89413.1 ankyrin repeat-containing protein H [Fluoribacter dumoffii NY 23]MCW8386790.1 ankyrin repeat domain-containing protein [Fluoribacter dumoffii]MCW8417675.1 ankyrin repeat domain-containing protein [Fluoribacter dumoffii]MCW8454483.1 ankyrin repeat domain-containing protein [Fluoribacter dumoffii]MCW8461443.1 ankyrin repeat domain-containing protein [Fluoribacter dumoffii]